MATGNDNKLDYTVRVKAEGLEKLGRTLETTEDATKDLGAAATTAGAGLDKLNASADKAGNEIAELARSFDEKTQAIKAALQVEQSEIELQRQQLAASQSEQQAILKSATARGDESLATQAQNRLRQIEAEQLALSARAKRTEAEALQQTTDARREQMALVGPLTAAQASSTAAAENHAKALRVQADAADQAAQSTRDLGRNSNQMGSELAELKSAVDAKTAAIKNGLQVEQSAIELQRQHLAASQAEQQARLQAAQAKGDDAAVARARNALAQVEADQLALVARAKRAEADATQQATAARREELSAVGPLNAAHAQELQAAENYAKALRVEAAAADQAAARARELGSAHEQSTSIISRLGQAWKTTVAQFALGNLVSDLFTTIANKVGEMGREFVRSNVEMDGMRRALTAIYKDGALAESQIAFLRKTANDAGVSYSSLTDSFKSFTASATAANIPLSVQNELFASVAQAGATLGLSGERLSQAMLALSQMASKGVVSMEELRGQLGESLPGALSLVSKGLGLAEADLIKLVESGGLAARDLFPALAQSLKTMSGENVGAAASWERLKSAITQVFTAAGDSGGMTVLNAGVKLLAALLGAVLVPLTMLISGLFSFGQMALATGSIVAILADRTTTWAQKKQAMRTEVDALTEALRANAERVEGVNSAFAQAVGSTDQATAATGRATAAAGTSAQAAAALSSAWVATGFAMREAEANAARLAANAEKNAQAAKSEGEALVALARIRGDANVLADAEAQAAQRSAQALAAVAAERAKALEIAQAELTAKTNLIAGNAEEQKAREKDIKDLGDKVEKLKAEATASQEAANAARNGALASQAAAEARRDHSSQIKELTKELELAKAALQEVERLSLNDKRTAEDVRDAKERLTLAQSRLNDAYADNVAKQQANVAAAQTDAQATRMLLQAQLEIARVEEQRARLRGDEYGARQALIKQKEIEIAIMAAEVDASKLVAMAKIAETNAVREQLIASGQLTEAKKVELDTTIRAAEAQIKLAEARGAGVKLQQEALEKIRQGTSGLEDFGRAAVRAGDAGQSAAKGIAGSWGGATSAINNASQALQEYQRRMQQTYGRPGEGDKGLFERGRVSSNGQELAPGVQEVGTGGSQFRNKDGWSSDATGKAISQGIWTRTAIIDYLKQSGLDEQIAIKLSEQFIDANGNVPYLANDVQKRWAGKFGTLSEALGKMAEYYKYTDEGQADAAQILDFEKRRRTTPQRQGSAPPVTGSATGSSSGATGATYVSNITIPGVAGTTTLRYADAESQRTGEDLLRKLAQAKGASI